MAHTSYIDEHGVQFSLDRTILENCPVDFRGPYVIPDSVKEIGFEAFAGCVGLTKIKIPNSVKIIAYEAFSGCKNLTRVDIPNSVTTIEEGTFEFCCYLKNIDIPDSVTEIEPCAFDNCLSTIIRIHHKDPNQIKVDESAFWDCAEHSKLSVPIGTKALYSQHPVFGGFRIIIEMTDEEWADWLTTQ